MVDFFCFNFSYLYYGNEDLKKKTTFQVLFSISFIFFSSLVHIITFMYFAYLYQKNVCDGGEKKIIIVLKVVLVLFRRWKKKDSFVNISCEKTVFEFLEFYVRFFIIIFQNNF